MTLIQLLKDKFEQYANNNALSVDSKTISYKELDKEAKIIADSLTRLCHPDETSCGIFAAHSVMKYTSIIGSIYANKTYVPLNPDFPILRTCQIIEATRMQHIIVDSHGLDLLPEILNKIKHTLTIITDYKHNDRAKELQKEHPQHKFVNIENCLTKQSKLMHQNTDNNLAYIIFTSGSTGAPKGVTISNNNLVSFIQNMNQQFDFYPNDKFSAIFDITFDFSVLEMFICWSNGAELRVLPKNQRVAPWQFLLKNDITVFSAVPSSLAVMAKLGIFDKIKFPSMRLGLFCGEPLLISTVKKLHYAAENAKIINLYGPTEATVACTFQQWDISDKFNHNKHIVPIGKSLPNTHITIRDQEFNQLMTGEAGELCLSGSQISPGYWDNPEQNQQKFILIDKLDTAPERWYKTGDFARINKRGALEFIGRIDSQVKIQGYRVELGDIETCVQNYAETNFAIAISKANEDSLSNEIIVCIDKSNLSSELIIKACKKLLPHYMVPTKIVNLSNIPLNANGKIDKNKIEQIILNENKNADK